MTEELLTVGQVSERFGVTVRTLHHYDAIGLVQPAERGWNGYRLYSARDIQRLVRVVLLRRLEMPLSDIAEALDGGDLNLVLRARKETVMERVRELQEVLGAIETALNAEGNMNDYAISSAEMKEIFGAGYDESYDVEAQQRWGGTEAFKESRKRAKEYDADQWRAIKAESDDIVNTFVLAMRSQCPPAGEAAAAAVQAHRGHIERWFNPVPLPMLRGMGEMYSADPRFAETYDSVEPGLSSYLAAAIAAYCDAHEDN